MMIALALALAGLVVIGLSAASYRDAIPRHGTR